MNNYTTLRKMASELHIPQLDLVRLSLEPSTKCLFGELSYEGTSLCLTLENIDYALEPDNYQIDFSWSPKFSRKFPYCKFFHMKLPIICGSTLSRDRGIRIHCGNEAADSQGCVLLGSEIKTRYLQGSKEIVCDGVKGSWSAYARFVNFVERFDKDLRPIPFKITYSKDFVF